MAKTDFKIERRDLYRPGKSDFVVVDVPEFSFLMVDGKGDPNTSASYAEAVAALYSLSYAAKFASKAELGRDYVVGPLEGLWDSDRMGSFIDRSKNEWRWTMMIRQPEWITDDIRAAATEKASTKGTAGLDRVRSATLREGLCAQIMHLGSYDDEGPTLARLHEEFLPENGLIENGLHHEIYLGDPRRTAPEKLKTILRQPARLR